MGFINFHNHSIYSFQGSLLTVEELVRSALEHSFKGCCITDTLSTYGFYRLEKECRKNQIRPVYGLQLYVRGISGKRSYPVILIARDNTGIENLFALNTMSQKSFLQNSRYSLPYPVLTRHANGLTLLLESEILAHKDSPEILSRIFTEIRAVFKENFYLEMNYTGEQKKNLLKNLVLISEQFNVPAIAACETRCRIGDTHAFELLMDIRNKTQEKNKFHNPVGYEYQARSKEDFYIAFRNHIEYIDHAENLFESISAKLDVRTFQIPSYYPNSFSKLQKRCEAVLLKRNLPENYSIRLKKELQIVAETSLADLFLLLYDAAWFLRKNKIPYQFKRGFSASSLVLYLLHVSKLDPVKNGLRFELLINPDIIQIPETGFEIQSGKKQLLMHHLVRRYGRSQVACSARLEPISFRNLIRQAAKTEHLSQAQLSQVNAVFSYASGFRQIISSNNQADLSDPKIGEFLNNVRRLEACIRIPFENPETVLIVPRGVKKAASLQYTEKNTVFAQIPQEDLTGSGLFHFDITESRSLTVINHTCRKIRCRKIPENDEKTMRLLSDGDTAAVFFIDGSYARSCLKRLKPGNVRDIAHIMALISPGPLKTGLAEIFLSRREAGYPEKNHPFLSETSGILIYREQFVQICTDAAGMDWAGIDRFRQWLETKNMDLFNFWKNSFITGAQQNRLSFNEAEELFNQIYDNAAYCASFSHTLLSAETAFHSAYLKTHYPVEYFESILNHSADNRDKLNRLLQDYRHQKNKGLYRILVPDINRSRLLFSREEQNLRCGLALVRNLNAFTVKTILHERNRNGNFKDLFDFYHRMKDKGITPKAAENLIMAGAFDRMEVSRKRLLEALPAVIKECSLLARHTVEKGLFGEDAAIPDMEYFLKNIPAFPLDRNESSWMEFESTGLFLSMHPLDNLAVHSGINNIAFLEDLDRLEGGAFEGCIYKIKIFTTATGKQMASAKFSDRTGSAEAILYPPVLARFFPLLKNNNLVWITGSIRKRKIMVNQMSLLPSNREIDQPV